MNVETFERPGGWRLVPEESYLLDAESFDDLQERRREAKVLPGRLEELDSHLADLWRRERDLRVRRRNARAKLQELKGSWKYDQGRSEAVAEVQSVEAAVENLSDSLGEVLSEIQEVRAEREAVARHLDQNFMAVSVERGLPDLSPPDEQEVKNTRRKL